MKDLKLISTEVQPAKPTPNTLVVVNDRITHYDNNAKPINIKSDHEGITINWSDVKNKPTLFSGDYNDLVNKPPIGSDLTFRNGLRLEDRVVKWGSPSHDSTEGLLEGETYVTYKNGIYDSQLQFLENMVRLYCGDETNNSEVSVSSNNFEFFAYNGGYSSTFSFTTTYGFEINDNIHSKGLKYGNDYSANGKLDDRWIPDWGAVKSHVTWGNLANKPTTFAPIIGTTSTTAKAGNYTPSATEIVTAIEAMTPEQVSAIQTKLGITPAVE